MILDVMVTTGAAHDTTTVEAQLEAVAALTGVSVQVATMDAGDAITRVFADLEHGTGNRTRRLLVGSDV